MQPRRSTWAAFGLLLAVFPLAAAPAPPRLLAAAIAHWDAGAKDLAFTQLTTLLSDDGHPTGTRLERYDPSLPDSRRWHLLAVDGRPPTDEERHKWEDKRNRKPRKKPLKSLSEYVDLASARLVAEDRESARYDVQLRPETARFVPLDKLAVSVTVDKAHAEITRVTATLREPMKIALGLARVTGLDFDVSVRPDANPATPDPVTPDSTASVTLSKFGDPVRYRWTDFKRVDAHTPG